MSDIKLSFCIPTYNRANYIRQTLTSISDQIIEGGWTDNIEICVSDNASTDNTDDVIHNFIEEYPSVRLVYSKNNENIGADRNYLRVVELATGDYCWLMGSDDTINSGAVSCIISELCFEFDILLCNRINCDINLVPIKSQLWLSSNTRDRKFNFKYIDELREYLHRACSIGALFSYLSSIIVKRSAWKSIKCDDSFIGTAYVHVYILLSQMMSGATLKYITAPLVLCRGENDSFASEGIVKRMLLDLYGYKKLALIIEDQDVRLDFLKVMTRHHPWSRWFKIRITTSDSEWANIKVLLLEYGFEPWKIKLIGYVNCLYKWMAV